MKRLAVLIALLPTFALAAPARQDYAWALDLAIQEGKPVQEVPVPDAVYAGVRNADLSDVAVFNSEGLPLTYAYCASPAAEVPPGEALLPVFPLQVARAVNGNSETTQVEVQQGGNNVQVTVQPGAAPNNPAAHGPSIIDARSAQLPLQALRVEWELPDGASEIQVRVEASDDLDHWSLVTQSTLLQANSGVATLRRARIPLPPAKYAYLRVERADAGAQPVLNRVTAEMAPANVDQQARWNTATKLPGAAPRTVQFDVAHTAPYSQARIDLPAANMALNVTLESRATATAQWRAVWQGEVFTLSDGAVERRNPQIRFNADTDRYWRVQVGQGEQSMGSASLGLQLGYQPALLRFLAQGAAPFVLAYGSARAERAPSRPCDDLLAGVSAEQLKPMLGQARAGDPREAAGAEVLTAPPKPAPLRQIMLWTLLIGGALLLIRMATSLIGRLNQNGGNKKR